MTKLNKLYHIILLLKNFLKNLLYLSVVLELCRDNKAINEFLKVAKQSFASDMTSYFNHLTKYSFGIVLNDYEDISVQKSNMDRERHIFSDEYIVSNNGECNFSIRISMGLPFSHMLFVRKSLKLPLFDTNFCFIRWTKKYFIENSIFKQKIYDKNNIPDNTDSFVINKLTKTTIKQTEQRKFNEDTRIMKIFATRVSEKTGPDYDYWIDELKKLVQFIEDDEEDIIKKIDRVADTAGA